MKEAKQEYTCREERITSWDHCFQPLDHRVRISCCYHDVMPQIKGDKPSVIWLTGKKNASEQSRCMKLCKGAADVGSGLPFNYLANKES